MDPFLIGGALVAGFGVGALAVLVARRRGEPEEVVQYEVVTEERAPSPPPAPAAAPAPDFDQTDFAVVEAPPAPARPPAPRSGPAGPARASWAPREAPPEPVPTEWARRHVGPVESGRTKGVCSGCGTTISVSTQRPLRIACPVCGRTRLLA